MRWPLLVADPGEIPETRFQGPVEGNSGELRDTRKEKEEGQGIKRGEKEREKGRKSRVLEQLGPLILLIRHQEEGNGALR